MIVKRVEYEKLGIWECEMDLLSAHCSAALKNTSQQGLSLPNIKTCLLEGSSLILAKLCISEITEGDNTVDTGNLMS